MTKKIIILIISLSFSMGFFSFDIYANTPLEIYVDKTIVFEDYEFTIDIKVDDVENLVGFQFKINYHEDYSLNSVSIGTSLTQNRLTINHDEERHSVSIVYVDVTKSIDTDKTTLVSFNFTTPDIIQSETQTLLTLDSTFTSEFIFMSETYQLTQTNAVSFLNGNVTKAILGDVNIDGSLSLLDVALIQLHIAQFQTLEGIEFRVADINNDGDVDITDAAKIQLYLADLIDNL